MDYSTIINALRAHAEQIARAIAQLESLNSSNGSAEGVLVKKRRGRKAMGEAERQQVSERMKRYWAALRSHRA